MSEFRPHGANPEKLYESMGIEMPERIIDFSTNTNALPWKEPVALKWNRLIEEYPDEESSLLRGLLAEKNNCSAREILVTNGSNEAIYLLAAHCAAKGSCAVLQPVYGEYVRALKAWNAKTEYIFSLDKLKKGTGSLWLCNPCNPTGSWTDAGALASALGQNTETDFIVDEAYIDFLTVEKPRLSFRDFPNLIVLRSLTKLYRFCGARAGYVLAASGFIEKIKRRQPTWSVNGIAQAAAAIFLKDDNYPRLTREFYRAETPRLAGMIREAGFNTLPTCVNFFLVETQNDEKLIRFLLRRGLAVRHTRNFFGLDGKYVRIAARLPHENELLALAFREFSG